MAYEAQISGIRMIDGPMTDAMEATAFTKHMGVNDIYSCRCVLHVADAICEVHAHVLFSHCVFD